MIIQTSDMPKTNSWRFSVKTLLLVVTIVAVAVVILGRQ